MGRGGRSACAAAAVASAAAAAATEAFSLGPRDSPARFRVWGSGFGVWV